MKKITPPNPAELPALAEALQIAPMLIADFARQWTSQKREPWQRDPIRFALTQGGTITAHAETIAELIAQVGDIPALWEGIHPAPLSQLAEIFEAPKTGKCRQCGSPCVESDHRCDPCINSDYP